MNKLVRYIFDNKRKNSIVSKMRQKRFKFFISFLNSFDKPINILDVGGTQSYWEMMDFIDCKEIHVTLLNLTKINTIGDGFSSIVGDARDMKNIQDQEYDIVYSNSVIEHLNVIEDQEKMVSEIKRVGKYYFLQTPNKYFPIEPHFLFPFFQFFPLSLKAWLVCHFNVGSYSKVSDFESAKKISSSIRLLSKNELSELFKDSIIYREKFLFLTKSLIVYNHIIN